MADLAHYISVNLNHIETSSPYRAVNTHSVSVIKTSKLMLFVLRSIQNTQVHCVGRT